MREIQAAQEQVLTSRRQLQQQLEDEANRAVQDGLNASWFGRFARELVGVWLVEIQHELPVIPGLSVVA